MKLEKREVTLNEKDTLYDQLCFAKLLLKEYVCGADKITSLERRSQYITLVQDTLQEIFILCDFLAEKEGK